MSSQPPKPNNKSVVGSINSFSSEIKQDEFFLRKKNTNCPWNTVKVILDIYNGENMLHNRYG